MHRRAVAERPPLLRGYTRGSINITVSVIPEDIATGEELATVHRPIGTVEGADARGTRTVDSSMSHSARQSYG